MFTKGQLVFAGFFVIAFIILMIWSYRKDVINHNKYYKNTALKVGFWMIVAIALFSFIRIYSKS
ncbi:MAG: heme/copper-type cytochrome/quinol oxidase subunit 2 [Polaribacter sp.]|jgi:heme/copper-type cytochrome/quinol oxidase subunit 2